MCLARSHRRAYCHRRGGAERACRRREAAEWACLHGRGADRAGAESASRRGRWEVLARPRPRQLRQPGLQEPQLRRPRGQRRALQPSVQPALRRPRVRQPRVRQRATRQLAEPLPPGLAPLPRGPEPPALGVRFVPLRELEEFPEEAELELLQRQWRSLARAGSGPRSLFGWTPCWRLWPQGRRGLRAVLRVWELAEGEASSLQPSSLKAPQPSPPLAPEWGLEQVPPAQPFGASGQLGARRCWKNGSWRRFRDCHRDRGSPRSTFPAHERVHRHGLLKAQTYNNLGV